MHHPPPLTRQRLLALVAAINGDDEVGRRLAEHDLADAAGARSGAQVHEAGIEDDPAYRAWLDAYHGSFDTVA